MKSPKSQLDQSMIIDGYFLSFTPEEKKRISDMLYELGYNQEVQEGLKKWILDCAADEQDDDEEEEEEENIISGADKFVSSVQKLILENPDKIIATGEALGQGINKLWDTITKKKRSG